VSFLASLESDACGGQPPESRLPDDIPGLIEALASPNKPPTGGRRANYPPGFDHAAQERVFAAQQKLAEKGIAAFPYLVEHLSDTRYSRTGAFAVWVNLSVGRICEQILTGQVLPAAQYKARAGADGEWHTTPDFMQSQGGVKKWWSTHSTKSLREMKTEALVWTIEQEKKIGFPGANDRKEYLEPLEAELRALQSGKKIDPFDAVPRPAVSGNQHR
jgi:hypothetical protein